VDALEAAGLVERAPQGRYVVVRRSPRGDALVHLYDTPSQASSRSR